MQATSTTTSNSGASSAQVSHKGSKQSTRNHRDTQWLNVKDLMHSRPQQNSVNPGDTAADEVKPKHPCEEVTGVRRIWGTMRSCTSRSVLSVLQRLSSVAPNVEVRRKFKKTSDSRIQWWFLVCAEEAVLQVLDREWEAVHTQTSWKLERCHKPATEQIPTDTKKPEVSTFLPIT